MRRKKKAIDGLLQSDKNRNKVKYHAETVAKSQYTQYREKGTKKQPEREVMNKSQTRERDEGRDKGRKSTRQFRKTERADEK